MFEFFITRIFWNVVGQIGTCDALIYTGLRHKKCNIENVVWTCPHPSGVRRQTEGGVAIALPPSYKQDNQCSLHTSKRNVATGFRSSMIFARHLEMIRERKNHHCTQPKNNTIYDNTQLVSGNKASSELVFYTCIFSEAMQRWPKETLLGSSKREREKYTH